MLGNSGGEESPQEHGGAVKTGVNKAASLRRNRRIFIAGLALARAHFADGRVMAFSIRDRGNRLGVPIGGHYRHGHAGHVHAAHIHFAGRRFQEGGLAQMAVRMCPGERAIDIAGRSQRGQR